MPRLPILPSCEPRQAFREEERHKGRRREEGVSARVRPPAHALCISSIMMVNDDDGYGDDGNAHNDYDGQKLYVQKVYRV